MYYKTINLQQIHIPKTAGTSVMHLLDNHFGPGVGDVHSIYRDLTLDCNTNVFTIIRNPWDRVVSLYHWIQSGGPDPTKLYFAKITKGKSFDEYVDLFCRYNLSQYDYIKNGEYRIHLIRYEHLQHDLDCYFNSINLKVDISKLPHIYKTDHQHWSCYYNEETFNKIKVKEYELGRQYQI